MGKEKWKIEDKLHRPGDENSPTIYDVTTEKMESLMYWWKGLQLLTHWKKDESHYIKQLVKFPENIYPREKKKQIINGMTGKHQITNPMKQMEWGIIVIADKP